MLLGGTNILPLYSRIKWGKQAKSQRMTKCFTDGCFSIMNREPWNDCSTSNCKLLKTLQSSLGTEATVEVRTGGEVNTYLFRGEEDSGLYISSPAQGGERSRISGDPPLRGTSFCPMIFEFFVRIYHKMKKNRLLWGERKLFLEYSNLLDRYVVSLDE